MPATPFIVHADEGENVPPLPTACSPWARHYDRFLAASKLLDAVLLSVFGWRLLASTVWSRIFWLSQHHNRFTFYLNKAILAQGL